MEKGNNWELNEKHFGVLWPFIIDDAITDIDWDCNSLWLKYADGKTVLSDIKLDEPTIMNLAHYVANHESKPFNATNRILTSDTDTLRLSFVHDSFSINGTCFSIRKSLPKVRFSAKEAIESNYCTKEGLAFLINSVKAKMNMAFCGEPGAGKTECAKFCSCFISEEEKVITIEDVLEWHYSELSQRRRCISLKVDADFDYTMAIKTSLRLNPNWIMLSEARSTEVRFLLESWSTGVHGMTTLHTNDVANIPDRIVNMAQGQKDEERLKNNVFMYLNVGVLLAETVDKDMVKRRKIKQICFYYRENEENKCHMIMDDYKMLDNPLPLPVKKVFQICGIENPFVSEDLNRCLA